MGIFDAIASLQKMADDPEMSKAASAIGATAIALPQLLTSIDASLKSLVYGQETGHNLLREISAGLDSMSDPIKRPPFTVADVEAAMGGLWPPAPPCSDAILTMGGGTFPPVDRRQPLEISSETVLNSIR